MVTILGTWGVGAFENDDSADWLLELAEAEDASILAAAFSRVSQNEGYLEAPDCCLALAAAEVVAAIRGRPAERAPTEVMEFVNRTGAKAMPELLVAAKAALHRIKTQSELRNLWDEADGDEWLGSIVDLEARLA